MSRLIEEENKKKSLKNQNHNGEQDSEDDDDEDDEDFVPNELADQSESEDDLKEDDLAETKTKKGSKRKLKKKNGSDEDEDESGEVEDEETDPKVKKTNGDELGEFDKKKADDLWSSFLKDVKSTTSSSSTSASNAKKYESQANQTVSKTVENEKKIEDKSVKDIFENFKSKIVPNNEAETKPVGVLNSSVKAEEVKKPKPGGMASILNKINKQPKINTLEKSKLDWEEFKKNEKIEDELNVHSKGKQSYLERMDFLARTDLRQFEIEKELRNKERRLRDSK